MLAVQHWIEFYPNLARKDGSLPTGFSDTVFHSLLMKYSTHGSIVFSSTVKEPHLVSSKYSDKSKRDKHDESDSEDDELDGTNEAT